MKDVLEQAVANCAAGIAESGAAVTCDSLPTIMGDATQLGQLFQELVGNAVKFRREGVRAEVRVTASRQGREWVFCVQDNGIGIPADQFQRVFLIFQRLHTQDEYPGAGIGLAICKKIVERHGGRIWVESKVGEGSRFQFSIPS
jgi:light-regulated signal transduction histidine kinase (bacteriophytochrome)